MEERTNADMVYNKGKFIEFKSIEGKEEKYNY